VAFKGGEDASSRPVAVGWVALSVKMEVDMGVILMWLISYMMVE
jgi:hypothetical protein